MGVNNFERLFISIPKGIELNPESKPKLILIILTHTQCILISG